MGNQLLRPLQQIENEIDFFKCQFANNTIEIGKRLMEAKQQLNHGEWGSWLEEKIEFSSVTAQRFMRVASEFSNTSTLKDLNKSKIFALLDVPKEEREEFISQPHEVNGQAKTVDKMTTRELQKVIKERNHAEEENKSLKENQDMLNFNIELLKNQNADLETKLSVINEPIIKEVEKEVIKEVIPQDYEKFKRESESNKNAYNDLYQKKIAIEKELESLKFKTQSVNYGIEPDLSDLNEFKYSLNIFLRKSSALIYVGDQFKLKSESEIIKWQDAAELLQKYIDDLKSAISGNSVGATTIYLDEWSVKNG